MDAEHRGRHTSSMDRAALCTLLGLAGCGPAFWGDGRDVEGQRTDEADDIVGAVSLDDVQQKSSHNSYERHETLVDQLALHQVRSIELDIHVGKFGEPYLVRDWYVYHKDVVEDGTSCRTLTDCFESVLAFTDAIEDHEVLTIWIDLKDGWDADHRVEALDEIATKAFGSALLTPADVVAACPGASTLADAIEAPGCGWPRLQELRGRIMLAVTGGDLAPESTMSRYLERGHVAFVAPSVSNAEQAAALHPGAGIANVGLCSNKTATALGADCNVDDAAVAAIEAAVEVGRLVRVWGIDDETSWDVAADAGAHHLGTDYVSALERPWAGTHNEHGWPFACDDCDDARAPEATIGVVVSSGDLWTHDDSFVFASRTATQDAEWTAMVATPNSHVEDYAKGCLMARTSLDTDAAYLAVCRPADEHPARVQVRLEPGDRTHAIESVVVEDDTVAPDSAAWLRLVVDNDGHCAHGYAALRRGPWVHLASQCFDVPLVHQGLAASAHGGDPVHFAFAGSAVDGEPLDVASLQPHELGGAEATLRSTPVP